MPTWVEAYNMARASMAQKNGAGAGGPRVTNQDAAALLRFALTQAKRLNLDPAITERWYEVALALAGWRQPGDKFQVTLSHKNALLDDAHTAVLWQIALNVAQVAQNKGAPFVAPSMDPSKDYDAVIKKAWEKMLADRGQRPPFGRVNDDSSPATSPASEPEDDDSEDGGSGLLFLLALFVLGKGKL